MRERELRKIGDNDGGSLIREQKTKTLETLEENKIVKGVIRRSSSTAVLPVHSGKVMPLPRPKAKKSLATE